MVAAGAAIAVALVAGSLLVARSLAGGDHGIDGIDLSAIKRPAAGTWLGSWVGSRYGHSRPERERAVLDLESKLGRKLAIDHTYVPWGTSIGWQPAWDLAEGRIPMISFGNGGDTREVAAGRHDAYLRSLAEQVRVLGRPVLLRYAYEMDGDGNRDWVHSGPEYVAAWRPPTPPGCRATGRETARSTGSAPTATTGTAAATAPTGAASTRSSSPSTTGGWRGTSR